MFGSMIGVTFNCWKQELLTNKQKNAKDHFFFCRLVGNQMDIGKKNFTGFFFFFQKGSILFHARSIICRLCSKIKRNRSEMCENILSQL